MKKLFFRWVVLLLLAAGLLASLLTGAFAEEAGEDSTADSASTGDTLLSEVNSAAYLRAYIIGKAGGQSQIDALKNTGESYAACLDWFLNDQQAMRLYVGGGAPVGNKYYNSLKILCDLYAAHSEDLEDASLNTDGTTMGSLYERMMITLSLTHANGLNDWKTGKSADSDPVKRYEIFKDLRNSGYLYEAGGKIVFDTLNVEEMRWVLDTMCYDCEIKWLNNYVRSTKGKVIASPYTYITYTFGYQYGLDKYYSEDNYDTWNAKYNIEEYNLPYGDKTKVCLWQVFEEGSVCGGISKTAANICACMGVPSAVIGQPGHAAYLQYGYDTNGLGSYWALGNNVSGWTKSEKGERMPLAWGTASDTWNSYYQVPYVAISIAAMDDYENYTDAELILTKLETASTDNEKLEICKQALKHLSYHLDAWYTIASIVTAKEGVTVAELLEWETKLCEAMPYFPLPLYDISQLFINKADTLASTSEELAQNAMMKLSLTTTLKTASNQPNTASNSAAACRTMASYLLGNVSFTLASFSFDGEDGGCLVFDEQYSSVQFTYCLDYNTKKAAGEDPVWSTQKDITKDGSKCVYQFSAEELAAINATDDIKILLTGLNNTEENYFTIDITEGASVGTVGHNDYEKRFVNANSGFEYRMEGEEEWKTLAAKQLFKAGDTVYLRRAATGTKLPGIVAGPYKFTDLELPASRSYISVERFKLIGYSSEQANQNNKAIYAADGIFETLWHTNWTANSDLNRFVTYEFNEPVVLSGINYWPRNDGSSNGQIRAYIVWASLDGEQWYKAAEGKLANNNTMKTINFANIYTKYVKFQATDGGGSFAAAREIQFFEDTRDTTAGGYTFTVLTEGAKLSYLRGESLNTENITARIENSDNGYLLNIPTWQLLFDADTQTEGSQTVFETVGEEISVKVSCGSIFSGTFNVSVSENELVPATLAVSGLPDDTDYVLDEALTLEGIELTATAEDGTVWLVRGSDVTENCTVSPEVGTTFGESRDYTVTLIWKDTEVSCSFDVTVEHTAAVFTQQPEGYTCYGELTPEVLTVAAKTAGGTIHYQWYKTAGSSTPTENDSLLEGATEASYTPTETGYYYCKAWVTDSAQEAGETVNSECACVLIIQERGKVVNSSTLAQYESFSAAWAEAASGDTLLLYGDVTLDALTDVSDKTLTVRSASGAERYTLKRDSGYTGTLFNVTTGSLTLENVILDGGAVWTGEENSVIGRGIVNSGVEATASAITLNGTGSVVIGDGCTIQNVSYISDGKGSVIHEKAKGAIRIQPGAEIKDCNSRDGAILLDGSGATLAITGGNFHGNYASRYAGVVMMYANTSTTMTNASFHNNYAITWGGAVFSMSGSAAFTCSDTSFVNNGSGGFAGALFFGGPSTNNISNCSFVGNTAKEGGAVCTFAAGKYNFINCEFTDNYASNSGGAIFDNDNGYHPTITATNCIFTGNRAENYGGVIYLTGGSANLTGGYVRDNSASLGSGIYVSAKNVRNTVTLTDTDSTDMIYLSSGKTLTFKTTVSGEVVRVKSNFGANNEKTGVCLLTAAEPGTCVITGGVSGTQTTDSKASIVLVTGDETERKLIGDEEVSFTLHGDCSLYAEWTEEHIHSLVKHEAVAKTCTTAGNIEYWQCSDETCGKCWNSAECETEITLAETVVPASHGAEVVQNAKSATCTEAGYTGDTCCSECGAIITQGTEIPATGHRYAEGVYEYDQNNHWQVCTVCGAATEAVAHTPEEAKTYTEEELAANPSLEAIHCSVCGCVMTAPHTHSDIQYVEAVAATCCSEGHAAYYQCLGCGMLFSDAEGTSQIYLDSVITAVDSTNHSYIETVNARPATVYAAGYTGDKVCKGCGATIATGQETEILAEPAAVTEAVLATRVENEQTVYDVTVDPGNSGKTAEQIVSDAAASVAANQDVQGYADSMVRDKLSENSAAHTKEKRVYAELTAITVKQSDKTEPGYAVTEAVFTVQPQYDDDGWRAMEDIENGISFRLPLTGLVTTNKVLVYHTPADGEETLLGSFPIVGSSYEGYYVELSTTGAGTWRIEYEHEAKIILQDGSDTQYDTYDEAIEAAADSTGGEYVVAENDTSTQGGTRYVITQAAAKIVDTGVNYTSLADAVANAAPGETIKLLCNGALTSDNEIREKSLILDLGGKTLTFNGSTDDLQISGAGTVVSTASEPTVTVDEKRITDETVREKIKTGMSVTGVKLTSAGSNSGIQQLTAAALAEAKKDNDKSAAVTSIESNTEQDVNVQIHVAVKAEPTTYDSTEHKGDVMFKLTPVATVAFFLGDTDEATLTQTDVAVTNDMIDRSQDIEVTVYAGFKPAAVIHRADDGSMDTFTEGSTLEEGKFVYDESNGTVTVIIHHFSELELIEEECPGIYAVSLMLESAIKMSVYVDVPGEANRSDYSFQYTFNGETVTTRLSDMTEKTVNKVGKLYIDIPVAVKEFADVATLELYKGTSKIAETTYSVQQYCETKIAAYENNSEATEKQQKLVSLCYALLDYGTAMQQYKGYNTGKLANANYTKGLSKVTVPAGFTKEISDTLDGIEVYALSILHDKDTVVSVYVQLESGCDISSYTFKSGDTVLEAKAATNIGEDYYYIDLPGKAAKEMNNACTLTITASGSSGSINVSYSPLAYAYNKQSSTNAYMADVAKGMYQYYRTAEDYFAK